MMDDASAIRKCLEGESEAFRHLVEQYQAQAISHAIAILSNREDALDAVQESFLDAFQALGRFDLARRFYPWFYIILRNRCYKLLVTRSRRETSSLEDAGLLAQTISQRPEEVLSLERALSELTPQERELITLKHLDGLSYEELAERLEIPDGTVMSRLYHARKRLHEKLTRRSTKSV
jgi:RNA polymerase sigma-70 factor, ECF subfamily